MTVTIDGTAGITTPSPVVVQGSTSGSITLAAPAVAGTNTVTIPAGTGTALVSGVPAPAGTTSTAPILLTSGTNLTTATAGAIEYDGKAIYATPQGTQRGLIPNAQYIRLQNGYLGSSTTSAQPIFGKSVTLSSNTAYVFELHFVMTRTNTAAHTMYFGWGLGSGATATSYNLSSTGTWDTTNPGLAGSFYYAQSGGATALTNIAQIPIIGTSGTGAIISSVMLYGSIGVGTGGVFTPNYQTSAAVGPFTTSPGSYMLIYPVGTSTADVTIGTWA